MFKGLGVFAKYPYTAGIIAVVWISTAILAAIDTSLPLVKLAAINMIFTTFVAAIGFRSSK